MKRAGKIEICVNNDGRPICPPSKVLCRECAHMIREKKRAILARFGSLTQDEEKRKKAE